MANVVEKLDALAISNPPAADDDEESPFHFQALLLRQQAENEALLAHLEASAAPLTTAPPAAGTSFTPTTTKSAAKHQQPHAFLESSAPDDDLIPPSDSVSAHASVRDAAVSLLNLYTIQTAHEHLLSLVDGVRSEFEDMLKLLWEEGQGEEVDKVNREVLEFVEGQRKGAVRWGIEGSRVRLGELARLKAQMAIGELV